MSSTRFPFDPNFKNAVGAMVNDGSSDVYPLLIDSVTHRLLVDASVSLSIGAEHAEDAVVANGATGSYVLGMRQDADTSPVSNDGDYHTFIFDNAGNLKVNVKASGSLTVDSELPTAAALADDTANPTAPAVAAHGMIYDPGDANWDRLRGLTTALNTTAADSGIQAVGLVAQFDDSAPTSITENQFGNLRMSANRNQYVVLRDNAGNERGLNIDSSGNITVNVTGSVDTELPAAASLADDTANPSTPSVGSLGMIYDPNDGNWDRLRAINATLNTAAADSGIQSVGLTAQFDDVSPTAITENQWGNLRMSTNRNVYTTLRDAAGNERGLNIDANGEIGIGAIRTSITPGTSAAHLGKAEDAIHGSGDTGVFVLAVSNEANTARAADGDYIAFATDTEGNVRIVGNRDHDAVDAGETVKVGYFAVASNATRVAASDRTHGIADLAGRQVVNLGHVREMRGKQTTTISASTSETTIVTAGGAGVLNDLVALIISNTSASTNTRVDVRDDTAGTILFSLQSPGNSVVGFSLPGSSIPQTGSNKNWTAQCGTSTTDLRVLAIFEKNT